MPLELIHSKAIEGVSFYRRIQSDGKVGRMFGIKTVRQSGKGNMLGEGPKGQQSGRQLELLQQGNRRGNMLGRIQSDIKVGCMIGIDPINLV